MEKFAKFWETCVKQLKEDMIPYQFDTWICRLTATEKEGFWFLFAPTQFMLSLIKDNCLSQIIQIQKEFAPDAPPIELRVGKGDIRIAELRDSLDDNNNKNIKSNPAVVSQDKQIKLDTTKTKRSRKENNNLNFEPISSAIVNSGYEHTRLKSDLVFENLVVGKSNQLAHSVAMAICESLGKKDYNPFFIYGSTGLGKTHLVQAIANRVFHQTSNKKVRYVHADKFITDFIRAVRKSDTDSFKNYYQGLDLLILDDVQFIAGKEKTMEEFFYLFNHILDQDKQIILTSDRLPAEIEKLDTRLQSRFSWGLTVEIEPPELEMRVAILMKKAASVNFRLPDNIAFFIAQSIKSNVRDLEGALNRVKAHCKFTNEVPSIDLVKSALKDILAIGSKQITVEDIQKIVADYYHIKVSDIKGKNRARKIVRPRQIAMALSKDLTEHSLPFIGEAFGGKDHTTVIHAHKTIVKLRQEDSDLEQDYKMLINILNS